MEQKVKQAIAEELKRQAENRPETLNVVEKGNRIAVHGEVDLDDLVMVVVGSVAGGP
ncbi:hypothetical protein [Nitratireductor sp. GCM10026969]|uniref:hypothetical protein n=1 Tax=Nitratireductor sp. GCM10026969 TaxID=3252645 RepID=UPI00360F3F78